MVIIIGIAIFKAVDLWPLSFWVGSMEVAWVSWVAVVVGGTVVVVVVIIGIFVNFSVVIMDSSSSKDNVIVIISSEVVVNSSISVNNISDEVMVSIIESVVSILKIADEDEGVIVILDVKSLKVVVCSAFGGIIYFFEMLSFSSSH